MGSGRTSARTPIAIAARAVIAIVVFGGVGSRPPVPTSGRGSAKSSSSLNRLSSARQPRSARRTSQSGFQWAQPVSSPRGGCHLPSPRLLRRRCSYLHGNEGNLAREVDRLQALRRLGLPILAIDYRGYGQSSGPPPSEAQLYEDAAAAWNHLTHVIGLEPTQLVIYGHSLGGAVAAELALRQPAACAIVLESTFTSMADMGRLRYPIFPIDWLLNQRFDTAERVARLLQPIVIVHGTRDDIVPVGMAEQLFVAAREPKRLLLVHGGHEDALQNSGQLLHKAITQLVQQCAHGR